MYRDLILKCPPVDITNGGSVNSLGRVTFVLVYAPVGATGEYNVADKSTIMLHHIYEVSLPWLVQQICNG